MSTISPREEIAVYSEKYDIHGTVKDYGVVIKLFFAYEGREIVMGLERTLLQEPPRPSLAERGKALIESYISHLASQAETGTLRLHYWYIEANEIDGTRYLTGKGIVTGHPRLQDSMKAYTSPVQGIVVNEADGEVELMTGNSVYHCPLAYCRFGKQDEYPDVLPDYERLKSNWEGRLASPSIEPGKVLLVLADFCEYYFHSLFYIPADAAEKEPLDYTAYPHVGMIQDSYLIETHDMRIDLRYFPHFRNITFYREDSDDCPLFIENTGYSVLYAKTHCGTICLQPGDRKEVIPENTESDPPSLPGGDLYPAAIL